ERATEPSGASSIAPENPNRGRVPEGTWIRGRVRIPDGLPPDDRVEVAARFVSLEEDFASASPVDECGRFVVAFPADVDAGWLELRSRYLFLDREFDIDLDDPPAEVVLEPRLGGCVRGRLVSSRLATELA